MSQPGTSPHRRVLPGTKPRSKPRSVHELLLLCFYVKNYLVIAMTEGKNQDLHNDSVLMILT